MNSEVKAVGYGLVSVACWSTVATAFKLSLAHLDVYQLVFYATATASVILLAVVVLREGVTAVIHAFTAHWRITLIAGLLNPVVYYLVLFKAYDLLPAQVAQPINYTWSIVLTLMAIVFLGQRVRVFDLIAAAICYGGVFLIATQGSLDAFGEANLPGVGLALLSTFIWAGYWILNIRDPRSPAMGLALNFLIALPVTFVICITFSTPQISLHGALGAVYVGVMEMAVAFLFWSAALRITKNASRVSNLIFLSPFLSLFIINRILGEEIYITTVAGLVMIVCGLVVQQLCHGREQVSVQGTQAVRDLAQP